MAWSRWCWNPAAFWSLLFSPPGLEAGSARAAASKCRDELRSPVLKAAQSRRVGEWEVGLGDEGEVWVGGTQGRQGGIWGNGQGDF